MAPDPSAGDVGALPDPSPQFPADRSGVAILGCGGIAQAAHLPAYEKYDVGVAGVWSRSPETTREVLNRFPFVGRVYDSADDLLADPEVRIVDLATGPAVRLEWLERAIDAGKHVLAQKPLVMNEPDLHRLASLLERADAAGVVVAANHNARWAPPWRLATLLVRAGAIGDVVGVTHLHDKALPPLVGTPFDDVPHMLLTDYLLHWIDISRCWLEAGSTDGCGRVARVQASDSRVPGQPADSVNPWSATINLQAVSGATATLRIAGNVTSSDPGCPFWIHGTTGSLRGSVLLDSDRLVLDRGDGAVDLPLSGAWFVDGFAGTMAELMSALAEGRPAENAAAEALTSARLMLAAAESADTGGTPVAVPADVEEDS
ncbi:putative Oxidoreductase domain protein [metagenome]|uniref:Putative Oxidoreductase domain protein n=1 Tax=metagenome TaxID=256318 RepID=A0A2P2CHJ9_9ZZZZ